MATFIKARDLSRNKTVFQILEANKRTNNFSKLEWMLHIKTNKHVYAYVSVSCSDSRDIMIEHSVPSEEWQFIEKPFTTPGGEKRTYFNLVPYQDPDLIDDNETFPF